MRRFINIFFLVALVVFVAPVWAQKKNTTTPKPNTSQEKGVLFFDLPRHNFGKINEQDGVVEHSFAYRNIGKFPVSIIAVESGCGCTVADYDRTPIKPGQQGVVTIVFDPRNRIGALDRTVTVRMDGKPEYAYLTFVGEVVNPESEYIGLFPAKQGNARFSSYNVTFDKIMDTKTDSVTISMLNTSNKIMHITSLKSPLHIRAEASKSAIVPNEAVSIKVYFYGEFVKDYGHRTDEIFIQTSDDSIPKKILTVRSSIYQDFSKLTPQQREKPPVVSVTETEHDFGELYLGETGVHEFKITNKGKSDLLIKKVKTSCGCTVTSYSKEVIKKGKTGTITVKLNTRDLRGNVSKDVTVIVNDPKQQAVVFKVKAKVVIPGIDPLGK